MLSTIHQWVEKGKDLPVLSGSMAKLMSLTQSEESNVSQIAETIKRDVRKKGHAIAEQGGFELMAEEKSMKS